MPVASGDPTLTSVGPSVSSRPAISHASLPPAGPDSVAGGRFVPGDLVNQRYRVVGPDEARKKLGLRTDEVTMIGDTMETDIRGAVEDAGFSTR